MSQSDLQTENARLREENEKLRAYIVERLEFTALGYLRQVYSNPNAETRDRMRAAETALPFEAARGGGSEFNFADQLAKARQRRTIGADATPVLPAPRKV